MSCVNHYCPNCDTSFDVSDLEAELAAAKQREEVFDKEECLTCKATRWEHSVEQWEYCQSKLRERAEELQTEIHEWEESDKAAAVLRPILSDEKRAEVRRKTVEEIAAWAHHYSESWGNAIRAKFL